MNKTQVIKFVTKHLKDLAVSPNSDIYKTVYANAIEGAEIMSEKELVEYIEGQLEIAPNNMF